MIKHMYQKLLDIQKEIGAISKDAENPFFKSKYFDINSLLEQVKPVLNKHGVILLQGLTNIEGKAALSTKLIDCDNKEAVESVVPLPELMDPQKMGSAITYYRRYALQSLLALQAEDDDGNSASVASKEAVVDLATGNVKHFKI
jgi:hypothetical protein